MTAAELQVGDVLVTRIGHAPIKTIERKAEGLELVLDVDAEGSTRAPAQGSVLFLWPTEPVKVVRKARGARVSLPLDGDRLADERKDGAR